VSFRYAYTWTNAPMELKLIKSVRWIEVSHLPTRSFHLSGTHVGLSSARLLGRSSSCLQPLSDILFGAVTAFYAPGIPSLAHARSVIHPRLPVYALTVCMPLMLTFYPFTLGSFWFTAARSFALCPSVQLVHSCTPPFHSSECPMPFHPRSYRRWTLYLTCNSISRAPNARLGFVPVKLSLCII
jgi:hypothetical protein